MKTPIQMTWLLGSLAIACAQAAAFHPHADIEAAAEAYVLANAASFAGTPEVEADGLDSRLRLSPCDRPLEAFEPPGGLNPGNSVVGVRCTSERPWKLYVPVRISLPGEVITTAGAIRRGEIITRAHLSRATRDLSELHRAYYLTADKLIGSQAKRDISPGSVISPAMLDTARLVKRGKQVSILSASDLIQVQMKGKALANGGPGDLIKVRNSHSGRILSATVIGPGLVRVQN